MYGGRTTVPWYIMEKPATSLHMLLLPLLQVLYAWRQLWESGSRPILEALELTGWRERVRRCSGHSSRQVRGVAATHHTHMHIITLTRTC